MSKQMRFSQKVVRLFWSVCYFVLLVMAGCSEEGGSTAAVPPPTGASVAAVPEAATTASSPTAAVTIATATIPPTPTPQLAALVNNQPITLADFQAELARYEQAQLSLGLAVEGSDYQAVVLNALIEKAIIEQTAAANNLSITPEMVEAKIVELTSVAGSSENFLSWLQANQLSEAEFAQSLEAEMLAEQVVALITADVPTAVEQVRARYIQVNDAALAQSLADQARAGADFAALAQQYSLDRVTGESGGDLGFFAPGTLLVPEIETAAFALDVDGVSDVIAVETEGQTTYYIVQVIERDPARPLTADQRSRRLQETFEGWLAAQRNQANIVIFVES